MLEPPRTSCRVSTAIVSPKDTYATVTSARGSRDGFGQELQGFRFSQYGIYPPPELAGKLVPSSGQQFTCFVGNRGT